jgi:putative endonuclease
VKTYYVYMLLCSDGSFYVGITNDVERRVAQHNLGWDPDSYTHSRRPVSVVHSSDFGWIEDAIRWEKQLKGWSRKKKQALVRNDWEAIHQLARKHRPLSS